MTLKVSSLTHRSLLKNSFAHLLCLLLFLRLGFQFFSLAISGEQTIVAHIPDDAFYYLGLAKNFAEYGTFKINNTIEGSGFHLLQVLYLSTIYQINPNITFYTMWIFTSSIGILVYVMAYFVTIKSLNIFSKNKILLIVSSIFYQQLSCDLSLHRR